MEVGGGNWCKGIQDLFGVMELFYILIIVVVMTAYVCWNSLGCTLKRAGFYGIKLYLNHAYFKKKKKKTILASKASDSNLSKTSYKKTCLHLLLNIYMCTHTHTHFFSSHVAMLPTIPNSRNKNSFSVDSFSPVAPVLIYLLCLRQMDLP